MARNAEFRTPFDGAYLGRVFPSFAVSSVFVRGCWEEGQSGTRGVRALRDGGGVRSAGRDCLRLIPLAR